jgi:CheY-like chemotaxis protein
MAKVLVVEDIAVEAEVLAIILEKHGYEIMTAADAAAALQACHRFLPDLVITDLELPELHGLALIARLHEVGADVGIIAMSGSGRALNAARALGVSAVLHKPIAMTDFMAAVRSSLPAQADRSPFLQRDRVTPKKAGGYFASRDPSVFDGLP